VEAACFACGASAVTFVDGRDDPVLEPAPGEFRLWPATRVQALFCAEAPLAKISRTLGGALGIPPEGFQARVVADRLWEREWLRDFHAMRFGTRLWVCPHHERVEDPDAAIVRMDPGLAFGTGTHPTTALCLEWLDAHAPLGCEVIDYGCGSGVLALAALRLGARAACCIDIDPQALIATRQNAAANGLDARVRACAPEEARDVSCDLLLANILSGPLIELATLFASMVRSEGTVVLAGLLEREAPEVTRAYEPWFDMNPFGLREGWSGLCGRRRRRPRD
jgi:ribosomal protein L11 methyltransferase